MNELDELLKTQGFLGFAGFYLKQCDLKSKSDDSADILAYTKLLELDTRLGTTACEALLECLNVTKKWNIIKVWFF